jgi:hypothetical protein
MASTSADEMTEGVDGGDGHGVQQPPADREKRGEVAERGFHGRSSRGIEGEKKRKQLSDRISFFPAGRIFFKPTMSLVLWGGRGGGH